MRKIKKLLNEQSAKNAAEFLKFICYLAILFFTACLVASFMGRLTFTLHAGGEIYETTYYAEKHNERWSDGTRKIGGFFTSMKDDVTIYIANEDEIDTIIPMALAAMNVVNLTPIILSFWFLSRVFKNVSNGQIFTEKNAAYLLYYGLINIATVVLVPLIKPGIALLANQFSSNEIFSPFFFDLGNILAELFPSLAFIVAAYIINYGVRLKDEVDHTL